MWRLKLDSQYQQEQNSSCKGITSGIDYARPDHMEIDDQFIYGTTRNSVLDSAGTNVFIWRVNVTDGLLNDGADDFIAR